MKTAISLFWLLFGLFVLVVLGLNHMETELFWFQVGLTFVLMHEVIEKRLK